MHARTRDRLKHARTVSHSHARIESSDSPVNVEILLEGNQASKVVGRLLVMRETSLHHVRRLLINFSKVVPGKYVFIDRFVKGIIFQTLLLPKISMCETAAPRVDSDGVGPA